MNHEERDWETRAIRIAAALDTAADELAALIEELRQRRDQEKQQEDTPDARRQP